MNARDMNLTLEAHSFKVSVTPQNKLSITVENVSPKEISNQIPEKIYTVREAAARLKVNHRTIRRYLTSKRRPLPHSRAGGTIRITETNLEKWLAHE
jgi:excisionase family DNA binding protein